MVMSSPPASSRSPSTPTSTQRVRQSSPPPPLSIGSLSRRNSRSQSTPGQQAQSPISSSLGESIFQSLSFGFNSKPMLADVLESPTSVEHEGSETPRPGFAQPYTSRRRVTSPEAEYPPVTLPDSHQPRKHRSTLRLSRLRPGLGKDEMAQLDSMPVTYPHTHPDWPQRTMSMRRPGSAGEIAHTTGSKARGMRVRASSELSRPSHSLSAILQSDDMPPSPLPLPPVPSYSAESALVDDSDVDAPTTPSLTTAPSCTASRSNSDARSPSSATPKPSMSNLDNSARRPSDPQSRQHQSKYFKLKGPSKERCHAFNPSIAPYPLSYSPKLLDHYNLETEMSHRTILSLTFHKFETPPAKVLDLGCGTGHWILKAAREWTRTEFVGFDLVPIQPNLERVTDHRTTKSKDNTDLRLHERIRWVHGNFLQKLPFQDNEFDYVRCRKIARGVPESKWDRLYEEIVRIMKPGAAFEQIEEDIVFPTEKPNKPTPAVTVYPTPSPSRTLPTPPYLSSTSLSQSTSSTVRTQEQYRRSPSTSVSSVIESPIEGRNIVPSVSSTASLTGSADSRTPLNRTTLVVPGSATSTSNPPLPDPPARDSRGSNESNGHSRHQAADYSFHDPREHKRLEELFIAMHDARWINLKPLSLIPRLIQEHMTGMMSSPPVNMYLPPRPREGPIPQLSVGALEIARASGDGIVKHISKMRSSEHISHDESMFSPQPQDQVIARYVAFDLSRMGSVSKGGAGVMPSSAFRLELDWLTFHLSGAVNEVLGCKEAIWEFLSEREPGFQRREYDAIVRQYQTDMQDRIGLSSKLRDTLHWGPPESDFMKTPEQRMFDEHYAQAVARDVQPRPLSLMRCYRSFTAFKPLVAPAPAE
ncbi:Methyltransferase domain, partial [Rhizoctonia solani]